MTSARPIAIILIAWTEDSNVIPALASGNFCYTASVCFRG
jgi:hypothetical protein